MIVNRYAFCLSLVLLFFNSKAQLYKIDLDKKINNASAIVEGKIVDRHSFWNPEHTIIYTANTIHIYKVFKGDIGVDEIEIVTEGGSVDNHCLVVSEVLQLKKNETGMFFCFKNAKHLHSPITNNILYDVYSSSQGFFKYDLKKNRAYAPFAVYDNIKQNLYTAIENKTGITEKTVDASFDANPGLITNGVTGTATITSFSPDTVHGGTLNDAAHNILTINGSGFGNIPSASAAILFKSGDNGNADPDYAVTFYSPYIISWADNRITLNVPDHAATGKIAVVLNDGTTVTSSKDLQVLYSVLNAEFDLSNGDTVASEPRLMNTNGSGGYTYQFSTNTAGRGVDITATSAKATFERAVTTWKEIAGANFTEGSNTTQQVVKDDDINLVVFDNDNTGQDRMEDGVLEKTFSWFKACTSGSGGVLTAQKTGFDILIRNNGVSEGATLSLNDGPCFPQQKNYDLEMIILHELGHALNLAHINDDYEASTNSYSTVNPSKVMHYAILDYIDRRSPDAAAYQGALYTVTPQHNTYGNCDLFSQEMQPVTSTITVTDECPSTFPASPIQGNTKIFFDLVHATSNKFKDPSFTQVNCNNTGTFVTNNAYYAFMNDTLSNLSLTVSDYTLVPSGLSACDGIGIRLALYDVSSCPAGQSFPQPVNCTTFNSNGTVNISSLQTRHKYLLYFDGIRNTKASFSVTLNSDSTSIPTTTNPTFTAFPNPAINGVTTIEINNASGSFYQYALFDITGRLIEQNKISVVQSTQTFMLYLNNLPNGVYVLRLADDTGKIIKKTKILKL